MRTLPITGVLVCLALSVPAQAQSLHTDWSGFYIGDNIGVAINAIDLSAGVAPGTTYFNTTTDTAQIQAAGSGTPRQTGFTGGVVGGYNAQFGNIVIGLEGGANAYDFKETQSATATYISLAATQFTLTQTIRSNWIATLRPRLGWAADNWLVYVTGGLAFTSVDVDVDFTDTNATLGSAGATGRSSTSKTKAGWTLGAGGEYALSSHWSLTGQYLYADFGSVRSSTTVTNPGLPGLASVVESEAKLRTNLFLIGASYNFDGGLGP